MGWLWLTYICFLVHTHCIAKEHYGYKFGVSSIDCQNLTISNYWPIAAPQKYNSFRYGPTENAITEHHNFPEKIFNVQNMHLYHFRI